MHTMDLQEYTYASNFISILMIYIVTDGKDVDFKDGHTLYEFRGDECSRHNPGSNPSDFTD